MLNYGALCMDYRNSINAECCSIIDIEFHNYNGFVCPFWHSKRLWRLFICLSTALYTWSWQFLIWVRSVKFSATDSSFTTVWWVYLCNVDSWHCVYWCSINKGFRLSEILIVKHEHITGTTSVNLSNIYSHPTTSVTKESQRFHIATLSFNWSVDENF